MRGNRGYALPHDLFVVDFKEQTEWAWLIALAFFLGELGAGLFLISTLVGFPLGLALGLLIVLVGKSAAHLLYLGRPERFWRVLAHPTSSWISRGFIAMAAYGLFGALHLAVSTGLVDADSYGGIARSIEILATLSAFFVMVYDGFVMSYSPSIALWNSALLPVLFGTYALMGGATVTLLLLHIGIGKGASGAGFLEALEIILILTNLVMLAIYATVSFYSSLSARYSIQRLIREYSIAFFGGVVAVGLILTLMLSLYFATTKVIYILLGAAGAELVGDFLVILLVLKSGVFAPLLPKTDF